MATMIKNVRLGEWIEWLFGESMNYITPDMVGDFVINGHDFEDEQEIYDFIVEHKNSVVELQQFEYSEEAVEQIMIINGIEFSIDTTEVF